MAAGESAEIGSVGVVAFHLDESTVVDISIVELNDLIERPGFPFPGATSHSLSKPFIPWEHLLFPALVTRSNCVLNPAEFTLPVWFS